MDEMIANSLLLSESRAVAWLDGHPGSALISIRDTDEVTRQALPCTVTGPRLDLRFDDLPFQAISDRWHHPTRGDARAIIAFARGLVERPWPGGLVIHCAAGISRSAAALIGVTRVIAGSDADGLQLFAAIAWQTRTRGLRTCDPVPNLRLVALLDHELGLEGSLVRTLRLARLVMATPAMAEQALALVAPEAV